MKAKGHLAAGSFITPLINNDKSLAPSEQCYIHNLGSSGKNPFWMIQIWKIAFGVSKFDSCTHVEI